MEGNRNTGDGVPYGSAEWSVDQVPIVAAVPDEPAQPVSPGMPLSPVAPNTSASTGDAPASPQQVPQQPEAAPAEATKVPIAEEVPKSAAGQASEQMPAKPSESTDGQASNRTSESQTPAPPALTPADLEPLMDKMGEVAGRVGQLEALFEEKISRTEFEINASKDMSEQLQGYRREYFEEYNLPLLKTAMHVVDDIDSYLPQAHAAGEGEGADLAKAYSRLLNNVEMSRDMLVDELEDYSVESYRPEVGDAFVSGKFKIVGKPVETADPALDRTVAKVLSGGFERKGQVMSPARVKVYTYREPAPQPEASAQAEAPAQSTTSQTAAPQSAAQQPAAPQPETAQSESPTQK